MKKLTLLCLACILLALASIPAYAEFDATQAGLSVSGEAQQLGDPKGYGSA